MWHVDVRALVAWVCVRTAALPLALPRTADCALAWLSLRGHCTYYRVYTYSI